MAVKKFKVSSYFACDFLHIDGLFVLMQLQCFALPAIIVDERISYTLRGTGNQSGNSLTLTLLNGLILLL